MRCLCFLLAVCITLAACANMKQGHGKVYASGGVTQDVSGQSSGHVEGGVEYNFAKKPKAGYAK